MYLVVMLALDEISFLNPAFLHHIKVRLQRLLDCTLPFGGLLVLAMGDFHQLSPVNSASLMTEVVRDSVLAVPGRRGSKKARKVVGASERGISPSSALSDTCWCGRCVRRRMRSTWLSWSSCAILVAWSM